MLTSLDAPRAVVRLFSILALVVAVIPRPAAAELNLVQLWRSGTPAFGIYAPNENAPTAPTKPSKPAGAAAGR
jgi:hypothetical protein